MVVIGIDGGGSKTLCVGADGQGQVLATARGPGANPYGAGERDVEAILGRLLAEVRRDLAETPAAICLGLAGVDREEERGRFLALVRRLGHEGPALIVHDALIALVAGVHDVPGIVVVAGTGSIAYGRDAHRAARAGGWGYVLGDEGSGYWIGRRALSAVVRAADGRGPATRLTPLILAHYGIAQPQDLGWEVRRRDIGPAAIASLAAYVQEACAAGDPAAAGIVANAADELALSAMAVARRLELERGCPVVLAGTIFRSVPAIAAAFTGLVAARLPRSTVSILEREPVMGAVELALALARGPLTVPQY